ncbi:hypothetical protein VFPPC_17990 [Pochonia chlamydosporia 170]|uniref:Uncharacterized protein n=1 Tax=Pochonia chlamydosporia 170 TaxID=1380566 RepID=A0A219APS8_METCM|nr:hypothetical protein VFPPC_17990 [Pochonia chlamydosporia 170]OWT42817.1 hypothetical protein VFPPC_17990 [Pochonia chlamydosporia 170]
MDMDTQPNTKATYVALFESATGNLHTSYRSIPEGQDPEDFATDLINAYKQHTRRYKRIFYRGVLLKKPVVSVAKLSKASSHSSSSSITNACPSITGEDHFFVQEEVYDPSLTAAMHNTAILRNVDHDSFFEEYKDVMVVAGGPACCHPHPPCE